MNPAKLATILNEAAALHQRGELAGAEPLYRKVLKQVPQQPDALHLLGVLLDQRGDRAKGIALVRQALAAKSAFPEAHFNLARMLGAGGDAAAARRHYEKALVLKPNHAKSHNGLGTVYRGQGAYTEAIAAFEKALRHDPRLLDAAVNLCNTYRDTCDEANILKVAEQGLAIDPGRAQLWLLRSEANFTIGNLAEGWKDYAWRFMTPDNPVPAQTYPLPMWQGEDLASKGILIWGEQGVGDEIIFASMIAGIASRAKRCVVQTMPRLAPLFARSFPNVEVYGVPVPQDIVSQLHVQSPVAGLGQWSRPTFRVFPATGGYLKADPAKAAALRGTYLAQRPDTRLVGIAWGSHGVTDAAQKSVDLARWAPILSVPGVTFVNLQYGHDRAALDAVRRDLGVDILDDPNIDALANLDAFAAQVAAMDLVISSSNTAAHMAGALDVPTLCMVPRAMGSGRRWYWFGQGQYSPWYRSMTLFRQSTPETWTDVIADIATCLTNIAAADGANEGAATLREAAKRHMKDGALEQALVLIDRALQLDESADNFNARGMILARLNRLEDAITSYRRGIVAAPARPELYNNLGNALRRADRNTDASEAYAAAHKLAPEHPSIFLNHATALSEAGALEESLAALERLIAMHPDYVDAHYNRALVLLGLGRFAEGWNAFQWRVRRPDVHVKYTDFPQTVWSGEDLADNGVLIWTDLGLGDEILLGSIVPDAIDAARHVTLLCSRRLATLFRRSFPKAIVDIRDTPLPPAAASPGINVQMSLAELGARFRPSFASFPLRAQFLAVDENLRVTLRAKYLRLQPGTLLVGIAWRSGNPEIGGQKSIPLEHWLPLLRVPGLTVVSLQYGDTADEIARFNHEHRVNLIHEPDIDTLGDMDPVAAQVAAMDHVISISNTTVHLAGATGVPTWVLLPKGHARLWYWFRSNPRCVWYSSVSFREPQVAETWPEFMSGCASDLKDMAEQSRAATHALPSHDGGSLLVAARNAQRQGDATGALDTVTKAIAAGDSGEAWNLKGDIHVTLGDLAAATDAYRQAAGRAPENATYAHDLGRALLQIGKAHEAEDALGRARALDPGAWDILCDLGAARLEQGRAGEALQDFTAALLRKPDAAPVHFNQGNALQELGRLDEAEAAYRAAITHAPQFAPALMALAALLSDRGRPSESEAFFMRARPIAPHALFAQAVALAQLRYGTLREGFTSYEARFLPSRFSVPMRPFDAPRWQGEKLAGRSILIWTEQGLGDEILSTSILPDVISAAGTCTIECSERVYPLFQRSFPGAKVIIRRDPPDPATLGRFDFQSPAFSLARHLRTDWGDFPRHKGYLHADESTTRPLREKYRARNPTARLVGISWDSTARHGSRKRLPLDLWQSVLQVPGITFVSLQYGAKADDPQIARLDLQNHLLFDPEVDALRSLDASAAQVAAMDLVITVSNTTAHLAGAQNIPVWTLLPDGPGSFWYWFRDRTDSPWYPAMRFFRQPRPGDWAPVLARVTQALVESGP